MVNNMASSGLWENFILTKIITYLRWHHWLCGESNRCQDVRHLISNVAGSHTYQLLILQTQCVGPYVLFVGWFCGSSTEGFVDLEGESI